VIAILDYGMGNLRSVEKAFAHVGEDAVRTRDHDQVRAAETVVLPGVGAMPRAMTLVRELGFDVLLRERRDAGVTVIGICMGMQLLFDSTTELGGSEGLGLIPGPVERLDAPGLTVPHMGWSEVSWTRDHPLNAGLPRPTAFYHVHSFAPRPEREEDVLGTAEYGSRFASVVSRENVHGAQFHPEKSGPDGLALLANVAGLGARVPA
jgi:imidazole glycerol-phosphate synthase subunit HisH